jgi:GNAT superfamily N-acetyltransferase
MLIRKANIVDAKRIARVHVDTWRTTYKGIVPQSLLDQMTYEGSEQKQLKVLQDSKCICFVAVDEAMDQIFGFSMGGPRRDGPEEYKGELYGVYVREQFQGKGVGRQLTLAVRKWLHEQGLGRTMVWVLKRNPAVSFYEAQGCHLLVEKEIELAGLKLAEMAYGWPESAVPL